MSTKRGRRVVFADDDLVQHELLSWAGLLDYWEEHSSVLGKYNIITDCLEKCEDVDFVTKEWDADFPGRSGVQYKIYTRNSKGLKRQIREQIDLLLESHAKPKTTKSFSENIHSLDDVINALSKEAAIYQNLREPPGYRGMGAAIARTIENACKDFQTGEWDRKSVIERLETLRSHHFGRSIDTKVNSIINDLQKTTF
jgi:hypothetical protein